ncbi:MAG: methyltransferase domain-containing protein, partial [Gemmatimonadales bacterium]
MSIALADFGSEILDDPAADPAIVRESLRNIARSNRWFGGRGAVRFGLAQFAQGGRATILDIGTGLGDLPRDLVRWGARRGWPLVPVAVDRSLEAARLAGTAGIPTAVACAGALPVRDGSVDIVLLSQLLHHLSRDAAAGLLRECARVARRGIVVADLRRHRLAVAGFWLGSRLLRFDAAT